MSLAIGAGAAIVVIVTLAFTVSRIPAFQNVVKKIPMWVLLLSIACYVLIIGLIKG